MMDNKNNYINGNTVLVPEHNPEKKEKYEKLKKAKQERQQYLRQKRLQSKKKAMVVIALTFAMGVLLIARYSAMYNMQKNLTKIKTDISSLKVENESLKVSLLKADNLETIEDIAKNKLHMRSPEKNQVIYTDLTQDNFQDTQKKAEDNKQRSIVQRIKSMFY